MESKALAKICPDLVEPVFVLLVLPKITIIKCGI